MQIGKLSNEDLREMVFDRIKYTSEEVLTGAGIGEDCCSVRTEKGTVVISGDPITAARNGAGSLAVNVTANDIASAGAYPVCAVVTMLVPPSVEKHELAQIIDDMCIEAAKLKIQIGGGHTEITPVVNQTVINVTMIGKTYGDSMITTSGAMAGDTLVISKSAGIEGTLIIADDYLSRQDVLLDEFDNVQLSCMRECISVLEEGRIGALAKVHAMHDITEGGLIGAVREMCEASGCGASTDITSVPVLPVTRKLCSMFSLDPYRFISSGSMLFATDRPDELISLLAGAGIDGFALGKVTESGFSDAKLPPEIFDSVRDELYKLMGDMV